MNKIGGHVEHNIEIVLLFADWCHYCKDFMPIFNKAREEVKKHDKLRNHKVTFKTIPVDNTNEVKKYEIMSDYGIAQKFSGGVPTIIIGIKNKPFYLQIENRGNSSEEFLHNIHETLIKLQSIKGGSLKYKNKYLKYKNKYLQLKKNL